MDEDTRSEINYGEICVKFCINLVESAHVWLVVYF